MVGNANRGLNFGPSLGPIKKVEDSNDNPVNVPQGRWVKKIVRARVPVYLQSNPLEAGMGPYAYGTALEWIDDPEQPGEYIPGTRGSGGGSGSSSGGGSVERNKENGEPYAWAPCPSTDCCNQQQRDAVRNAYKKIAKLPCIVKNIFPGLFKDFHSLYKKSIKIACNRTLCGAANGHFDAATNTLMLCSDIFTSTMMDEVVARLLHELVHAAGAYEIDAVAIVMYCLGYEWDDIRKYLNDILNDPVSYPRSTNPNSGHKILWGKYVVWAVDEGLVYAIDAKKRPTVLLFGSGKYPNWVMSPAFIGAL